MALTAEVVLCAREPQRRRRLPMYREDVQKGKKTVRDKGRRKRGRDYNGQSERARKSIKLKKSDTRMAM